MCVRCVLQPERLLRPTRPTSIEGRGGNASKAGEASWLIWQSYRGGQVPNRRLHAHPNRDGPRRLLETFATVLWQGAPAWPRPRRLSAHQTFDLVQAARRPDPTRAIGARTCYEARPYRWHDRFVHPRARARAAFQPGMDARPPYAESHATGQTERCFAMKPNLCRLLREVGRGLF